MTEPSHRCGVVTAATALLGQGQRSQRPERTGPWTTTVAAVANTELLDSAIVATTAAVAWRGVQAGRVGTARGLALGWGTRHRCGHCGVRVNKQASAGTGSMEARRSCAPARAPQCAERAGGYTIGCSFRICLDQGCGSGQSAFGDVAPPGRFSASCTRLAKLWRRHPAQFLRRHRLGFAGIGVIEIQNSGNHGVGDRIKRHRSVFQGVPRPSHEEGQSSSR